MKRYSREELSAMAGEYFKRLNVSKLYATTDGQFFILQNRAQLHAGSTLTVYELENENPQNLRPEGKKVQTVKELTQAVQEITDVEVLRALLLEEVSGTNRASAVKVIEERIAKVIQ
jgi:hypothetical protein